MAMSLFYVKLFIINHIDFLLRTIKETKFHLQNKSR